MKLAKDKKLWIPDEEMWQNWCLNYEIKHWKEVVMHLSKCRTALDIGAHVGEEWHQYLKRYMHSNLFQNILNVIKKI